MVGAKNNQLHWRILLRRLMVTCLALLTGLVLLVLLGYQVLPLRQLQWTGLSLGTQQINVATLSFQIGQDGQWWEVQVQQLALAWRGWPLPSLQVKQLQLTPLLSDQLPEKVPEAALAAEPATTPSAEPGAATDFQLPGWPDLTIPAWLPLQVGIETLVMQLPCQSAHRQFCQLQGSLRASHNRDVYQFDVQAQGDGQQIQLQFELTENAQQLAALHVRQLHVQLDVSALAAAGWIKGLPADLVLQTIQAQLAGRWSAAELQLTLLQPLQVEFSYLDSAAQHSSLQLPRVQLRLASGQLLCAQLQWQQCHLQLDASANARQVSHPLVQVSDWQWQGQMQGRLSDLQLTGTLQNPQALKMTYQAQLSPTALKVQWQLADMFLLAGNPLQISRFWPELLELQRGKMSADGNLQLQLPTGKLTGMQLQANLTELYGIYDRTTFGGLTTTLSLAGDPRSFTLQVPVLAIKQINHGFQAGPAELAGQYRADWSAADRGEVRLQQAQLGIFGGQLRIAQTQFNLQQPAIELSMAVQQIQLAELLKQHPSGQMLGDGVLSGVIPLRYQQVKAAPTQHPIAQWQVFGGSLQAEAPGGRLQYQYQPLPGQPASGMDLALEALSDFRYQTLASTVELQPDGKVLLQVKLHGFNPKLQQGRPVHFNINVEEDLPALLTSLQLSGQISDKVRQRISQKIQQQHQQKVRPQHQQKPAAPTATEKQ